MTIFRPLAESGDEADLSAVAALWHDSWHDGHATLLPPAIVAQRDPGSFAARLVPLVAGSVVAVEDDEIVGFGALVGSEIDQLFVARAARGTAVAAGLLGVLEDRLREAGVMRAEIQCLEGNDRALAFYKRHGWQVAVVADLPIWMPEGQSASHPTLMLAKDL
jgi:GNAT superfamily N-acetyltransferase